MGGSPLLGRQTLDVSRGPAAWCLVPGDDNVGDRNRTGHAQPARTTEGGESVGGSSCGSQLSPGRCAAEMIRRLREPNGTVVVEPIGENLLPTPQACSGWGLDRDDQQQLHGGFSAGACSMA